jgi:hypothetical protein
MRAEEFAARGLSKADLIGRFEAFDAYARNRLDALTIADLEKVNALMRENGNVEQVQVGWALMHALEHTALHLGHAQITRQLWQQKR